MRLELAEETEPLVRGTKDLDVRANFVTQDHALRNYLNRGFGNSYDFSQSQ